MSVRITGGIDRGRRLRTYTGGNLRPTSDRVRSAIFSILGAKALVGARALDLYAGTGALGIEALSRGADWVDMIETNAKRCQQIRENLRGLSMEDRSKVYRARVENILDSLPDTYNLIFADPPYHTDLWATLMDKLNREGLTTQDSTVIIEHRYDSVLAENYSKLFRVKSRRYGDTAITFYKIGETNVQSHLPGQL